MPINEKSIVPIKSYAPERRYWKSDVPMEGETTMKLSYQPVEVADKVDKPWGARLSYNPPTTPMEDNTTYNMRFAIIFLHRYISLSDILRRSLNTDTGYQCAMIFDCSTRLRP